MSASVACPPQAVLVKTIRRPFFLLHRRLHQRTHTRLSIESVCYCCWCSLELVCGTGTCPWAALTCKDNNTEMWSVSLRALSSLCVGEKRAVSNFLWLTYKHWGFLKPRTAWTLSVCSHHWARDMFHVDSMVHTSSFSLSQEQRRGNYKNPPPHYSKLNSSIISSKQLKSKILWLTHNCLTPQRRIFLIYILWIKSNNIYIYFFMFIGTNKCLSFLLPFEVIKIKLTQIKKN